MWNSQETLLKLSKKYAKRLKDAYELDLSYKAPYIVLSGLKNEKAIRDSFSGSFLNLQLSMIQVEINIIHHLGDGSITFLSEDKKQFIWNNIIHELDPPEYNRLVVTKSLDTATGLIKAANSTECHHDFIKYIAQIANPRK